MTRTSSIRKIPLPDDAKATDSRTFTTSLGDVASLTKFYEKWFEGHGWNFDVKNSVMDPYKGRSKSLGFTTNQVWCKHTRPQTFVAIIVGANDQSDDGKKMQIIAMELHGEDGCP